MKSGGSWNNNPNNCRSAYRNNNNRDNRNNNIGFRVVCVAPSTLLYGRYKTRPCQNWQMGICRACFERVQTCSSDAVLASENNLELVSLVGIAETLIDSNSKKRPVINS